MKNQGTNCKQQGRRMYGERGSDSEDLQENGTAERTVAAEAVQHTDQSGRDRGGGTMSNRRLAVIWRIWEEIEEYSLKDLVEVLVYLRKRKEK